MPCNQDFHFPLNILTALIEFVNARALAIRLAEEKAAKYLEWDHRQLRHIAEIAQRVPTEGVAAVAKNFWRRGIKDRRGRPWGKPRPKPFSLFCTPYQSFYRAVRWFTA